MSQSTMPALFIGHGTPMNALEDNRFTRDWQQLAKDIPRPRAILALSAHWVTHGLQVTAMEKPRTIHDFGGFPPQLFAQQYPSPGAPELAVSIAARHDAILDQHWGLDHGTWAPLLKLFPAADIPVLQLSLDANRDMDQHVELARSLNWLRDDGVLILGSGNIVHNIRKWMTNPHPADWAIEFNAAAVQYAHAGDIEALKYLPASHPHGRDAVPTLEHYLPFLYLCAMRRPGEALRFSEFEEIALDTSSMHSMRIG